MQHYGVTCASPVSICVNCFPPVDTLRITVVGLYSVSVGECESISMPISHSYVSPSIHLVRLGCDISLRNGALLDPERRNLIGDSLLCESVSESVGRIVPAFPTERLLKSSMFSAPLLYPPLTEGQFTRGDPESLTSLAFITSENCRCTTVSILTSATTDLSFIPPACECRYTNLAAFI